MFTQIWDCDRNMILHVITFIHQILTELLAIKHNIFNSDYTAHMEVKT